MNCVYALLLLSFIASQHFDAKFIWHSMPMACFATEAAIIIEFEFIVIVVRVVWATLTAFDALCIVCCIARLAAPANSDRLLSIQFMLCPCNCVYVCVCVHSDCLSAHMFTSCTTSFLFLFLSLFSLGTRSFSTISVKTHLHFVVWTSLLHLHHNVTQHLFCSLQNSFSLCERILYSNNVYNVE